MFFKQQMETDSHRIEVDFFKNLTNCSSEVIVAYLKLFGFRFLFLFRGLFPF
ncbi:hypothetical protein Hanom_Chr04g00327291 [Helianthus anomalus]